MPKGTPNQYNGDFESLMRAVNTKGGHAKHKIKPVPMTISLEKVWALGVGLKHPEYQALFFLLYLTGQRISEALGSPGIRTGIKYTDFSRPNADFLVVRSYTEKNRLVPMRNIPIRLGGIEKNMSEIVMAFAEQRQNAKQIFSCTRQAACMYFRYHLRFTVEAFGNINDPKNRKMIEIEYRLNPHYLRHCRITHLVELYDYDHYKLTYFAGWGSTSLASIYVHFNWRMLAKPMMESMQINETKELKPSVTESVIALSGPTTLEKTQ